MKIDFHVHITPPYIIQNWQTIAEGEPYFGLLSGTPHNRFADAPTIIAQMDKEGLDKAVVFGFGFQNMQNCKMANDYVMESVARYPDRLIGFAIIPPNDPGLEEELDRCVRGGLRGVGEIFPDGQHWALEDEKVSAPFVAACYERNLPVIIHANEPVGHDYAGKTSTTPQKIAAFAEHHQQLTIIFAHWGGGLFLYECMPEMKKVLRNVYYDTAASPFLYDPAIYKTAKAAGVLDKILLGSDFPLLPASRHIKQICDSGLSQEEKDAICGGNAQRFDFIVN